MSWINLSSEYLVHLFIMTLHFVYYVFTYLESNSILFIQISLGPSKVNGIWNTDNCLFNEQISKWPVPSWGLLDSEWGKLHSVLLLLTEYSILAFFPFANSLGHQVKLRYEGMRTLAVCQETMAKYWDMESLTRSIIQDRNRMLHWECLRNI